MSQKSIDELMVDFHAQFKGVKKSGRNPHFNSEHFTLDDITHAVTPILNELGMYVVHTISDKDGDPWVTTSLRAAGGGAITSEIPLPKNMDPQKIGSAITYYKRYNLAALLSISEPDDDGQAASDHIKEKEADAAPATDEQLASLEEWAESGRMPEKTQAWYEKTVNRQPTFMQAARCLSVLAELEYQGKI